MPAIVDTPSPSASPTLLEIFIAWLWVGLQSWGGGTATQSLLQQTVTRKGWLSEGEFARALALCQLSPGMNLLALCVVLGRRIHGPMGGIVALLGLVIPSVAFTIFATLFWGQARHLPGVQKALQDGIVPAVVGVGLWTTFRTGYGLVREARTKTGYWVRWSMILLCGATLIVYPSFPVFAVLLGGGMGGALWAGWRSRLQKPPLTKSTVSEVQGKG
jgi:chromate transporter